MEYGSSLYAFVSHEYEQGIVELFYRVCNMFLVVKVDLT